MSYDDTGLLRTLKLNMMMLTGVLGLPVLVKHGLDVHLKDLGDFCLERPLARSQVALRLVSTSERCPRRAPRRSPSSPCWGR